MVAGWGDRSKSYLLTMNRDANNTVVNNVSRCMHSCRLVPSHILSSGHVDASVKARPDDGDLSRLHDVLNLDYVHTVGHSCSTRTPRGPPQRWSMAGRSSGLVHPPYSPGPILQCRHARPVHELSGTGGNGIALEIDRSRVDLLVAVKRGKNFRRNEPREGGQRTELSLCPATTRGSVTSTRIALWQMPIALLSG